MRVSLWLLLRRRSVPGSSSPACKERVRRPSDERQGRQCVLCFPGPEYPHIRTMSQEQRERRQASRERLGTNKQRWTVGSHFPWQTNSTLKTESTTTRSPLSSSPILFVVLTDIFRACWSYKDTQPFCWPSLKLQFWSKFPRSLCHGIFYGGHDVLILSALRMVQFSSLPEPLHRR